MLLFWTICHQQFGQDYYWNEAFWVTKKICPEKVFYTKHWCGKKWINCPILMKPIFFYLSHKKNTSYKCIYFTYICVCPVVKFGFRFYSSFCCFQFWFHMSIMFISLFSNVVNKIIKKIIVSKIRASDGLLLITSSEIPVALLSKELFEGTKLWPYLFFI